MNHGRARRELRRAIKTWENLSGIASELLQSSGRATARRDPKWTYAVYEWYLRLLPQAIDTFKIFNSVLGPDSWYLQDRDRKAGLGGKTKRSTDVFSHEKLKAPSRHVQAPVKSPKPRGDRGPRMYDVPVPQQAFLF